MFFDEGDADQIKCAFNDWKNLNKDAGYFPIEGGRGRGANLLEIVSEPASASISTETPGG